ncbi:hypothetical protein K933_07958 [Candidatus Halobonum tyrrellensis G22]|uniref:Uncharacterized protein n=1 Tax=Candidatus Halobonum tyrrellensis G22 TaxID=1324957 RepID=V4HEU4_9EURY|nr:hypothetical protein K933_07958 [Candidatus Halobonum tyrrellensis G22]
MPELALVTGVFLAVSLGGFALWATRDVSRSLLAAVVLLYPFALYAVRYDDDPTTVLPPRAVGAAGALAAAAVVADTLVRATDAPLAAALRGLFFGLVVALPPVAYAARYGARAAPGRARAVLAGSALGGGGLVFAGAVAGSVFGPAAGLLVALAGALYAHEHGVRTDRTTKLAGVAAGLLLAAVALVAGLSAAESPLAYVLAAVALVLAPGTYYALTVETSAF